MFGEQEPIGWISLSGAKGRRGVVHSSGPADHSKVKRVSRDVPGHTRSAGIDRCSAEMSSSQKLHRARYTRKRLRASVPHAADLYVGRQVAVVRIQSDVTQAELARAVRVSPQQLQKYENGKNRISASMLFEIATFLGVPVSRFFEGLPGNEKQRGEVASLPVDERITFIASSEGRRLVEGVMRLHPRMRRRVSSLIAALGEELSALKGDKRDASAENRKWAQRGTGHISGRADGFCIR